MLIFLCHSHAFCQRSNFYLLSAKLKFLPCRIWRFCFFVVHVTFFGYMGIIVRNNCVCEIIIMGWGRIIILQCRGIIIWLIQHNKKNDTSGPPDSVDAGHTTASCQAVTAAPAHPATSCWAVPWRAPRSNSAQLSTCITPATRPPHHWLGWATRKIGLILGHFVKLFLSLLISNIIL